MPSHVGAIPRRLAAFAFIASVLAAGALFAAPAAAYAHAEQQRSNPAPGAVVEAPPGQIDVWYTERVTAGVSSIQVLDAGRHRVDANDTKVDPGDPKHMSVHVRPLPPGLYTVIWSNISADDGHPNKGGFAFTVAAPPATAAPALAGTGVAGGPTVTVEPIASPAATEPAVSAPTSAPLQLPSESAQQTADLVNPATDRPTAVVDLASSWLVIVALSLAAGGAIFGLCCVLPALGAGGASALALKRHMSSAFGVALLVYGVIGAAGGFVSLLAKAEIATALPPGDLLSGVVLGALLAPWAGRVWLVREAALASLAVFGLAPVVAGRLYADVRADACQRAVLLLAAVASAIGLVCQALVSHLAAGHVARQGPVAVPALALHLLAVGAWAGGLGYAAILWPAWSRADADIKGAIVARAIPRFSALALASVLVIAVTGLYVAILLFPGVTDVALSAYGQALLLKTALFGALVALGAANRRTLARVAHAAVGDSVSRGRGLLRTMRRELWLALAALLAAATMLEVGPPGVALTAAAVQLDATATLPPLQTAPSLVAAPTPAPSPSAAPAPAAALAPSAPPTFHGSFTAGDLLLVLDASPTVAGATTTFDVRVLQNGATPVRGAQVKLFFTANEVDLGNQVATLAEAAPGSYKADVPAFAVEGDWQVGVVVRRDNAPQEGHTFVVPVSLPAPTATSTPSPTATPRPSPTPTPRPQELHAVLSFDPDPPAVGDRTATIILDDGAGQPWENAKIQTLWLMPQHAHVTTTSFEPVAGKPGRFSSRVSLSMAGAWIANVTVSLPDGRTSQLQFHFNVRDRGLFG